MRVCEQDSINRDIVRMIILLIGACIISSMLWILYRPSGYPPVSGETNLERAIRMCKTKITITNIPGKRCVRDEFEYEQCMRTFLWDVHGLSSKRVDAIMPEMDETNNIITNNNIGLFDQ